MIRTIQAATASALLFAAAIAAPSIADAQTRRAGLWAVNITGGPMGMMHVDTQSCTDPSAEKPGAMFQSGRPQANCSAAEVGRAPGGYSFHMVCKPGGGQMTMDTRGVATGDFTSGYVVKTTTRMDPAPMPQMAEVNTTMTARYLGPCPADMKPGDAKVNGRLMRARP